MAQYLPQTLAGIEQMPESTLDEIIDKYVEMNIAHPFREGNGRAMRIWLDLILKRRLKKCVDWSLIDKNDYLAAMPQSVVDSSRIKQLIYNALTDKIEDREIFHRSPPESSSGWRHGSAPCPMGSRSPGPAGCAGSPAAVLPCKGPWAASPAQCSHSLQKILHIVPHLPRFFKTAPANSGNLPLFSAF